MPLLQELFEKKVSFKGGHADIMKSSGGGRDIDTPQIGIQEKIQNIHDNAWRYIRSGKRPPIDLVEKLTELKGLHTNPDEAQRRRIKLSSSEFSLFNPKSWFGGGSSKTSQDEEIPVAKQDDWAWEDEGGNSGSTLNTPLKTDGPEDLDNPTTVDPMEFGKAPQVTFRDGSTHSTHQALQTLMGAYGNRYDQDAVASALGVFPGSRVTVRPTETIGEGFQILSQGKGTTMDLRVKPGREAYISNLHIGPESELRGQGVELARNQLVGLSRLGHRDVHLLAVGEGSSVRQYQNPLLGYYFWLKMGFSGQASDRTMALLRDKFGVKYTDLQDFATEVPGFMEYWKDHGSSWTASFDLRKGSKNWKALAHHIQQKQMKGRQ